MNLLMFSERLTCSVIENFKLGSMVKWCTRSPSKRQSLVSLPGRDKNPFGLASIRPSGVKTATSNIWICLL